MACVVALGLAACGDAPTEKECGQLLEHLIDLENKEGEVTGDRASEIKAKLREQAGPAFIERCAKDLPGAQVRCGLGSKSRKAVEDCDQG